MYYTGTNSTLYKREQNCIEQRTTRSCENGDHENMGEHPIKPGCHGFHAYDHENQVHEKNNQLNLLNQNMNDAEKSDGSIKQALIRQCTNVNRIVGRRATSIGGRTSPVAPRPSDSRPPPPPPPPPAPPWSEHAKWARGGASVANYANETTHTTSKMGTLWRGHAQQKHLRPDATDKLLESTATTSTHPESPLQQACKNGHTAAGNKI